MHFHNMDDMDLVSGMGMVAHAAAAWTARLRSWLHHGPASDTVGLPSTNEANELREELGSQQLEVEDEPGKRAIWAEAAAQEAMAASMGQQACDWGQKTISINGHLLSWAKVRPPGDGRVISCSKCGGYSWRQHFALLEACEGPVPGKKSMRSRLLKGQFPHTSKKWLLEPPSPIFDVEMKEIWEACGRPGGGPGAAGPGVAVQPLVMQQLPSKRQVLLSFGIVPEEELSFARWAKQQRKARRPGRRSQRVEVPEAEEDDYFGEILYSEDSS